MSAEHELIDLGDHDRRSVSSGGSAPDRVTGRVKGKVRLVAAFVVGVVLGGVVVSELRDAREERQQSTSVSLVAFVASGGSGGGDSEGVYQMAGQLAVINAGPAPITASAATGQLSGIRVRGTGQSRLLRPGGTGWLDVEVRIDCSVPFDSEPLSMRFAVETADGRVREVSYPVAVIGSAWHREVERPCAHLAGLVKDDG